MKRKHFVIRIEQCLTLSRASACCRGQVGALLLDPERNVILMDGYNGGPRGGGALCGGDRCDRDWHGLKHDQVEVGCHHAEMNVVCNAAAGGVRCQGAWLFVSCEPCLLCAKLIHHAGIARVVVISDVCGDGRGLQYLLEHQLVVQRYKMEDVRQLARDIRDGSVEDVCGECPKTGECQECGKRDV